MEGIEQGVLVVLSVSLCCVAALADFIATLNPLLGKGAYKQGGKGGPLQVHTLYIRHQHTQ